jgi:hypothetical protein
MVVVNERAQMRPTVSDGLIRVAVSRAVVATFDRSSWVELGELLGRPEVIYNHDRLLRSLSFSDDDYEGNSLEVIRDLLGQHLENLDQIASYVGLRSWLLQHDADLHDQLYEPVELAPTLDDLTSLRDPAAIEAQLRRMNRGLADDFEQAIGSAKELVESTARSVLEVLGVDMPGDADVPSLVRRVQTELGLHPGVLSPDATGADATKKILGGLTSVAIGVAELRNKYGTGHGRTKVVKLERRHAQLAVDAATVYCRTLLATLTDPSAPWRAGKDRPFG